MPFDDLLRLASKKEFGDRKLSSFSQDERIKTFDIKNGGEQSRGVCFGLCCIWLKMHKLHKYRNGGVISKTQYHDCIENMQKFSFKEKFEAVKQNPTASKRVNKTIEAVKGAKVEISKSRMDKISGEPMMEYGNKLQEDYRKKYYGNMLKNYREERYNSNESGELIKKEKPDKEQELDNSILLAAKNSAKNSVSYEFGIHFHSDDPLTIGGHDKIYSIKSMEDLKFSPIVQSLKKAMERNLVHNGLYSQISLSFNQGNGSRDHAVACYCSATEGSRFGKNAQTLLIFDPNEGESLYLTSELDGLACKIFMMYDKLLNVTFRKVEFERDLIRWEEAKKHCNIF